MIYGTDIEVLNREIGSLDRNRPHTTLECRISSASGRICWNVWTIHALFSGEGKIREYQGIGRDITEKKESGEKLERYIASMEFFSRKMQEFIELPPDSDICCAIAASLMELLPRAIIMVNLYDRVTKSLVVKTISGKTEREFIAQQIGRDLVGMSFPATSGVTRSISSGKLCPSRRTAYTIFAGKIPEETCTKIEKNLDITGYYALGLNWQDTILGSITIVLRFRRCHP